jgi:hypothetical protein
MDASQHGKWRFRDFSIERVDPADVPQLATFLIDYRSCAKIDGEGQRDD